MATVHVTARRQVMQFLLYKPPFVEIDGQLIGDARWGKTTSFEVSPGYHTLTVAFPYFWKARAGEASLSFQAHDTVPFAAQYRSPFIITMAGSLKPSG